MAFKTKTDRGSGQERKSKDSGASQVESFELIGDFLTPGEQKCHRGPGVKGDLEAFAKFRIETIPIPPRQAWKHCQMGGAGHRQEFGWTLDDSEDYCSLGVTRAGNQRFDSIPD